MVTLGISRDERGRYQINDREYTGEDLALIIVNAIGRIWEYFKAGVSRLLINGGGYIALDKIARHAAKYPFGAIVLLMGVSFVFLPLTILLAFGLSMMAMTFTGFLLLEGSLLTIASVLLFGSLGALLLIFLFFASITVAGYFGFVRIYDLYSASNGMSSIRHFLVRERVQPPTQS